MDVEIIESGKKKLGIQIYLHMIVWTGCKDIHQWLELASWMDLVSLKAEGMGQMYNIVNILEM